MATEPESSIWDDMLPWQRKLIYALMTLIFPMLLLSIFIGPGAGWLWLYTNLAYWAWKALRWALKSDQAERERGQVEKGFWEELRDIEAKVTGKKDRPDKKEKPQVLNSQGEPMYCILACGRYTNKGGRYCDEHDEG